MKTKIVDLEQYAHTTGDRWRWAPASGTDTQAIVDMAQGYFGQETAGIFVNDPIEYARNVTLAIVSQFYNPRSELVSVARDQATGELLAYTWAMRGQRAPWSPEEMVAIRIAHVNLNCSARERVFLIAQMMRQWEKFAEACKINIICSTTMRADQAGFLRLHEQAGYVVRGSIAYKRMSQTTFVLDEPVMDVGTISKKNTSYDPAKYSHAGEPDQHSVGTKEFRVGG